MITQSQSHYKTRKIDAEDLKVGDKFWDKIDQCFYEVTEIKLIPLPNFYTWDKDNDIGISTSPPNSRKSGIIRKSRFTRLTVQETRN